MTIYSSTLESYFVTLKFLWHKLTKRYYVFTCKYIPSNLSKTLTTKRPANCIHGPCDTVHIKLWCPKVMHSWVVCKYVPRHIRSGTKTILQFLQFSTGQLSLSLDQATQGQRIVRDSCLSTPSHFFIYMQTERGGGKTCGLSLPGGASVRLVGRIGWPPNSSNSNSPWAWAIKHMYTGPCTQLIELVTTIHGSSNS